jgi:hypothetical protein
MDMTALTGRMEVLFSILLANKLKLYVVGLLLSAYLKSNIFVEFPEAHVACTLLGILLALDQV